MCSQEEIPVHRHDQNLLYLNWTHRLTRSFSQNWQVGLNVPLQLRKTGIAYTLLDGTAYDPPYGDIHHRNEILLGMGDPQISLGRIFWWEGWGFLPQLQFSIPLGKTEENPYLRTQESQTHQHIQMGTGSVVPSLNFTAFYDNITWGFLSSIGQTIPFYENAYDYKPGASTDWNLGHWKKLTDHLILIGQIRGMHSAPERWMDLPYAGSDSVALNIGTFVRLSPKWELGLQLEKNIWIQNRMHAEEDPLNPILTWNVFITR